MNKTIRIASIHATPVSIEPIQDTFRQYWPEVQTTNLLDDSLSIDLEDAGRITEDITRRIVSLADYSFRSGADGILFCCSAFGLAIDEAKRALPIPVLKPNEAMFEEALQLGDKIGMLATFGPSVPSMEDEFMALANFLGKDVFLKTILQEEALKYLQEGDIENHNNQLQEGAMNFSGFDAVMLAQFSTSIAYKSIAEANDYHVLTSPKSAVLKLKSAIAGRISE